MSKTIDEIRGEIDALHDAGTYKTEPVLSGPMGPTVKLADGREVINLCSNNYLGLANHPDVLSGARKAMDAFGQGTASVRFICGTFSVHLELEKVIAEFCGAERATTYVSCWNANEALVPSLIGAGDAVISDELNHASIIDACRLCNRKVNRLVFKHSDMSDLARRLSEANGVRRKLIITDGVFSMEGDLANLPEIVKLAREHDALVAVDDSHAHGVVGRTGKGTPEHFGVRVDIITGTLGKALGGAAGGFIAGPAPVIELMVQRSRPQLFSNALPPAVAGGALAAFELLKREPDRVGHLQENVAYLRDGLRKLGYEVLQSPTAILPIIVGDTAKALRLADAMLTHGVLITGFGFPVVPEGTARLRAQVSSVHTRNHLDQALKAFEAIRSETGN
ncbi:MAG: glycine C-acetyltransferase [Planctomycetota bacterium]|nr:glycine C-acetyltransferase [Planctomycetota bacterium]